VVAKISSDLATKKPFSNFFCAASSGRRGWPESDEAASAPNRKARKLRALSRSTPKQPGADVSPSTRRLPAAFAAARASITGEETMTTRDMTGSNKGREVATQRGGDVNPFLTLHREINRMFDDVFRGFDFAPLVPGQGSEQFSWPKIEVDETDKEVRITAELPGLEEKDVKLEIANGVLSISGEKKSETEDKEHRFSERYYGRFERRIPLEGLDEDKASAAFKNGVLTVTLPKSEEAKPNIRRIPISSNA
jgi:HSP20 family protein